MPGNINGFSLAYTAIGGVVLWSGIKGETISDTFRGLLQGQAPAVNQQPVSTPAPLTAAKVVPSPGVTPTGLAIANDAAGYVGHAYAYGGAPGTNGTQPWDCSSFCNWVLGHDLGMTLPGMTSAGYSGTSHGPATGSYLAWGAATTVGHSASSAIAGDLCIWETHMGVALGNGNMISALNEQLGTEVTTISGGAPGGEALFVRRIK